MLSRKRVLRLIGLALFVFVLSRIDLRETAQRVIHARPAFLILAVISTVPLLAVRAWRLQVVLGGLDISLPYREVLTLRIVTSAAGDATPGRLGEFGAVAFLRRAGHSTSSATIAMVIDRGLDAGVFALTALAALSSFGFLPLSVSAVSYSTLRDRILRNPKADVWSWAGAGALSVAAFAVLVFRTYCLALALDIPISYSDLAGVVAISTFVQLLPISVLGIGSRDISVLYLFDRIGLPASSAISLSFLVLAIMVLQLAVGLTVWWRHPLRLEAVDESG